MFCIDSRVSSNYYLLKLYILDFFFRGLLIIVIFWSPHKKPAITGDKLFSCVCFWKWVCFFFQNIQHDLWLCWLMFVINYTIYLIWYYFYLSIYSSVYLVSHLIFVFFLLFLSYSFRLNLISLLIWFLYEKPTYTCFSDMSDRVLFIFYFKIKVFDKSWS